MKDKYIVTFSEKGNIKVWDLQMVLMSKSATPSSDGFLVESLSSHDLPTVPVYDMREEDRKRLEPSRKVVVNDCQQIVVIDRTPQKNGRVSDVIRVLDFLADKNMEQLMEMLTVSPDNGDLLPPGTKELVTEDNLSSFDTTNEEDEDSNASSCEFYEDDHNAKVESESDYAGDDLSMEANGRDDSRKGSTSADKSAGQHILILTLHKYLCVDLLLIT